LVHYVRTGDFVNALIDESENLNEYAFAIGLMSHYFADNYGHSMGTNRVVPLMFPHAREEYGDVVSYEEGKTKHIRVEFGFDVLQTAKGKYEPQAYHDFIGFKVSEPVLERALKKTYGLEVKDVFSNLSAAVSTFRFAVRNLIPEMTKDAWKVRRSFIYQLNPLVTKETFHYRMKRPSYRSEFGKFNLKSTFISIILSVLPKVGPLSALKFKEPTPEGEKIFEKSFNEIISHYGTELKKIETEKPRLKNHDYDTGKKTEVGEYKLANETYDKLLFKLQKKNFLNVNSSLKKNLLDFYDPVRAPAVYGKDSGKWRKIKLALDKVRTDSSNNSISTFQK
jgi:hypothetical protein